MPPDKLVRIFARIRLIQTGMPQIAKCFLAELFALTPPRIDPDWVTSRPNVTFRSTVLSGNKRIFLRNISAGAIRLRSLAAIYQHTPACRRFFS